MATNSVTMDCWVPGALFSLSEELSDNEGNPELGPGIEDAGAGMGIGMGEAPPRNERPDNVLGGSPYERSDNQSSLLSSLQYCGSANFST